MFKSIPVIVIASGLVGTAGIAHAAEAQTSPPPQEPAGFIAGAVIGGFAAGPIGAVVGAGLGTWLGNRVHRAGEAKAAERQAAELIGTQNQLLKDKQALNQNNAVLIENNKTLTASLAQMSQQADAAKLAQTEPATLLRGLQGDVLFRTASFELTPEMVAEVQTLAKALADSPSIKIRLDGYADPRGTPADNLKLSEARARAVRDVLLEAGVKEAALEVNAYGQDRSEAEEGDADGYALERRVRITVISPDDPAAVAQVESH